MTPIEIRDAARALAKEIGEKARVYPSIDLNTDSNHALRGSIYTNWPVGDPEVRVEADSWDELFTLLRERWEAHKEEHCRRVIRKMALEIIRVTAERGVCTDADLRITFTNAEVERLGADACSDANEIASNGPFEISRIEGANAA